jgi:hypothetical protein
VRRQVVAPEKMFGCLKQCLDGFSAAQAQVVCTLLETCGRYLHRRRDTQVPLLASVHPITHATNPARVLTHSFGQSRFDAMLELLNRLSAVNRRARAFPSPSESSV